MTTIPIGGSGTGPADPTTAGPNLQIQFSLLFRYTDSNIRLQLTIIFKYNNNNTVSNYCVVFQARIHPELGTSKFNYSVVLNKQEYDKIFSAYGINNVYLV